MTIGDRIKKRRLDLGLSVDQVADKIGLNRTTLYRYESNSIENVPSSFLEPLAKALNTTPAYLMGWRNADGSEPDIKPRGVWVPVYGEIAAGIPIEAIQDIIDYEEISADMAETGEYLALKIKGDSMEPRIKDGDVVIIRLQDTIENGEIAAVMVNGDSATLKQVKKEAGGVWLVSLNTAYSPMFYTKSECSKLPVRILGRLVELRAKF